MRQLLATGLLSFCPAYKFCSINTCKIK
ncbi:DUF2892 domain-containing protein [Halomonas sp. SpR1]